ncbi:hypothetical protein A1O1_04223 [Capronia coronata CBS 617.96]|uniref:Uncharacterized protein n=1 Tax=Capronia coronata CBS 617.96 TaxID=1182541 RepID=W9YPE6_9EURO|nr:uncharacterized protein A1O1_04223 [Capronia coronata CBS 617.96]EXJ91116.1 hypothetical protein A1O1_04223 [Capronia coronata CBS 617.96]
MDYECKPKVTDSCSDELPKGMPHHFATLPTYVYAVSSSTVNSFHTSEDRLLRGPRPLKTFPPQASTRTSSIGSTEEKQSRAFGSRRLQRPSPFGTFVRHSSAPSIGRSSRPTSRPGTNTDSIYSSTLAPGRPVVYMDAPNGCSDTFWSAVNFSSRPSTSSTSRPRSKSVSMQNGLEEGLYFPLDAAPEVEVGMGDRPGYTKIPLYVPRRIERDRACPRPDQMRPTLTPVPAMPSIAAEQLAVHQEFTTANPAISDMSLTSLQGQTSVQSHTEREQMLREVEPQPRGRPSTGSRDRLSKALTNAWSERTLRKKQKGGQKTGLH